MGDRLFGRLSSLSESIRELDTCIRDLEEALSKLQGADSDRWRNIDDSTEDTALVSDIVISLAEAKEERDHLQVLLEETFLEFVDAERVRFEPSSTEEVLAELAEECANALAVVIESFAQKCQREVVARNDLTQMFLEMSTCLDMNDQVAGISVPGRKLTRLSSGVEQKYRGIRVRDADFVFEDIAEALRTFESTIRQSMDLSLRQMLDLADRVTSEEWSLSPFYAMKYSHWDRA